MFTLLIAEQTYAKDQTHQTPTVLVDQTADGWSVKVSCEKWPKAAMGTLRVMAEFGNGPMMLCGCTLDGGGLDKAGMPCQFASIRGTWPGEAVNGVRFPVKPTSLSVEFTPIEPMVTTIEVDASLKASGVEIIGHIEVPVP